MRSPDVIVVGAGVIGCSVALRLAARGRRVLVLDAGIPGRRATAAAAGVLAANAEASPDDPSTLLAARSLELHAQQAEELRSATGIDVGFRRSGIFELVFDEAQDAVAAARMEWLLARGARVERLDAAAREIYEPSITGDVLATYFHPADAQIEPRPLVAALSQAAVGAGAEIRAGAPVRRVLSEKDRVTGVEVDGERLEAPAIVVCAGAWSSRIDGAGLPVRAVEAVRGQMIELELRPPPVRAIVTSVRGTLVPRPDGRILCGSTIERVGDDDSPTVEGMLQILEAARDMVPDITRATLRDSWAGLRPGTPDERPILGRGHVEGLWFATGHYRSGILLAPVTAEIINHLVHGEPTDLDLAPFAPDRAGLRPKAS